MMTRFGRGLPGGPGRGFGGDGFGPGMGMRPRGMLLGAHPFGGVLFALFMLAIVAVVVFLFWRIMRKAGFDGALALLLLVPFVNVAVIAYLALADWPVLKELNEWRMRHATTAFAEVPAAEASPPPPGGTVAEHAPTQPLAPAEEHREA